ncbi:TonB-dependent receptor [uncultured Algibacter sp.]|uniref:TonB-dependent receptor n=1 Tax=uncultured Algibacter sp. TaxID=298659 RepID=UPI00260E8E8C|nr:TonB-dependent receptor [uncultured Algibacter sp.]
MNAKQSLLTVFLLIFSFLSHAQIDADEPKFAVGFSTGYNRGFGAQISIAALRPLESLPVQIRFGIGLTKLNPGNSADARRIFINNATNGVPEEKAKSFDYRLDFMLNSNFINSEATKIVFGPRYSSFKANFKYVGGNEDFDVTSKQFGVGLGIESQFKINDKFNLLAAVGLDYFFNNTLKGHDTSYSPDNDNVNARNDNTNNNVEFTFKDANKAIKQPNLMPRVLIGLVYKL